MRKILICTPLRGDLSSHYLNTLFRVMNTRLPGMSFAYAFIGATSVQWARDECVQMARDKGCTEIVFWDKDLEPTGSDWQRIISHEKPEIVCGLYAKREPLTHWHATFIDDKPPGIDGLCEVFQSAIGFSKIKLSAFDKIIARTPERAYVIHNAGQPPLKLHEYFPMERFGPNTAAGKIERMKRLLENSRVETATTDRFVQVSDFAAIIEDDNYSTNQMHGEDYSFCRLAKEAGLQILVDTQLIIGHRGDCTFPLPTEVLEQELAAEWRKQP